MVWQQLRHLRHRDMLLGTLLRRFERDQLECRVLQSQAFVPYLSRWAEHLVSEARHAREASEVPPEVLKASETAPAEVKWLLKRLQSEDRQHRGLPHYPSVLKRLGPQYPFEPFELTYLRSVVGGMRGTELTQPIELPEASEEERLEALRVHQGRPVRDLWAEGCADEEDHMDHTKPPK